MLKRPELRFGRLALAQRTYSVERSAGLNVGTGSKGSLRATLDRGAVGRVNAWNRIFWGYYAEAFGRVGCFAAGDEEYGDVENVAAEGIARLGGVADGQRGGGESADDRAGRADRSGEASCQPVSGVD